MTFVHTIKGRFEASTSCGKAMCSVDDEVMESSIGLFSWMSSLF